MTYKLSTAHLTKPVGICIVGVGGTGGFVADGLCRLLIKSPGNRIMLVDHDRVETHNLRRQHFYEGDVGKFKSKVMAERLSGMYGREILYTVYPFHRDLVAGAFNSNHWNGGMEVVVVGCVDNARARADMTDNVHEPCWYIDAGNGQSSGQVLIGNIPDKKFLKAGFNPANHTCVRLPTPSLQLPGLLAPGAETAKPDVDCAQAVEVEDQNPTINQAMAVLVVEMVRRLLNGTLDYMGVYLDLEAGSLRQVPAMPETVARMCSVKVNSLMSEVCPCCGKKHD